MDVNKLDEMIGGWFIGNFTPSLCKTNYVEAAVKKYKAGQSEMSHYHKIATEYTVIVKGSVKMNGVKYNEGSIITIYPMEATDFIALTDVITAVIKVPGAKNDKFSN